MRLSAAPKNIINALQNCVRRFPVAVAFVTALTAFLIFNILNDGKSLSENTIGTTIYYLSVGYLLSLTLQLWAEEEKKQRIVLIVSIVAHLLLLADAFYIYHTIGDGGKTNWELYVAHAAAILSLWLSLFFLSFFKEKDNIASWNFAFTLLLNCIICYVIGNVLSGGFMVLIASFKFLFNIEFGYKWHLVITTLIGLLLPTLLFLGRIPQGYQKFDRKPVDSNFLNTVIRFLFLPLVGIYIIVLYVYALQILIRWELPNGWVSWLVVASMAGLILIEFGLYPVRRLKNKRTDNLIARYLPVVILPLLLLMTVGICRRFSDYGITISRLYLITLNAWFYFVCITLFITKARRINWITISFALVFLLTSAFPLNYFSITRKAMESQIKQTLYSTDMMQYKKLPLNEKQYKHLLHVLTKEEAIQLNDKMRYIRNHYGSDYTEAYVKDTTTYISFYYDFLETHSHSTVVTGDYYIGNGCENYAIDIPEGYGRIVRVYTPTLTVPPHQNIVKFVPEYNGEAIDTIFVNLDTLRAHENSMQAPIPMPCSSDKNLYLTTRFSISPFHDSRTNELEGIMVDITGFILQKK
ncbi:MAG: DUF4153 domain-containing protein [Bacteroidaceae bacterium]|nr:DUF4153 domain-containing protein [Bacteroidaceae bacterium]